MPDFTASIDIFMPADHVFEYVRDVRLLPSYVPFIRHAEAQQLGNRVQVRGEARGRPFTSGGEWRVDRKAMRVEWGVDSNPDYSGSLTVTRVGEHSRVDGMVRFRVWTQDMLTHHGEREWEQIVEQDLERALHALKEVLERRGAGAMHETSRAS